MKELRRNIVGTFVRLVVQILAVLATNMLVIKSCDLNQAGEYSALLAFAMLVSCVLGAGVTSSATFFIAGGRCEVSEGLIAGQLVALGYAVAGAFLTAIMLSILLACGVLSGNPSVWLGPPICFLGTVLVAATGLLAAVKKFDLMNLFALIQPVLSLGFVTLLVGQGLASLATLLVAFFASQVISGCFFAGWMASVYKSLCVVDAQANAVGENLRGLCSLCFKMIRYGAAQQIATFLSMLNYRLDIFLVHVLIGASGTALYLIAAQVAERLSVVSATVSFVISPTQAAAYGTSKDGMALTKRALGYVVTIDTVIAGLVYTTAPLFLRFTYAEQAASVQHVLGLLLVSSLANSPSRLLAGDIAARGAPHLNTITAGVALLLNLSLNIALIPRFGLDGAAVATVLSSSVNLFLRVGIVRLLL